MVQERGWTDLFVKSGFEFGVIGGLITNFHLPRTSLLLLVAAFAGGRLLKESYREAVARCYRFYSYGDAMLIVREGERGKRKAPPPADARRRQTGSDVAWTICPFIAK